MYHKSSDDYGDMIKCYKYTLIINISLTTAMSVKKTLKNMHFITLYKIIVFHITFYHVNIYI